MAIIRWGHYITGMTPEHDRYLSAWRRRRQLILTSLVCLFIPSLYLIFPVIAVTGFNVDLADVPLLPEPLGSYWFLFWFASFYISLVLLYRFRCPRCGNSFFGKFFVLMLFGGKCLHCNTPKGWLPGDKEPM